MKVLLAFVFTVAAFAQTATISDTIRTPMNGLFAGTVTVTLNGPAQAQPLYSGTTTLSGWSQTVTVTAGVFSLTLYANDQITPGGTSYSATYAPASGTGWKETWVVATGATTIRAVRSTTVPVPLVKFGLAQLDRGGASVGQGLVWGGSSWGPSSLLVDPTTTSGDLIYRGPSSLTRLGIGSAGQVLTVSAGAPVWATMAAPGTVTSVSVATANGVSGTVSNPTTTPAITLSLGAITPSSVAAVGAVSGSNLSGTNTGDQTNITGNAGTATALATDPADCTAGQYATSIAASGALTCSSVALSDVAGAVGGAAVLATAGSVPFVTASGVLGESANLSFDSANNRLAVGAGTVIRSSTDTSLSRSSAGIWQAGDGGANSNGGLLAAAHIWSNGTEGTCDSTLRGQMVMVQGGAGVADRLRICRKDSADAYAWAAVDNSVGLQVITAGPTATVADQARRVYVDPASTIASLTLTLPASPLDADQVQVFFGGTVANGVTVVTTLSIAPNTGQAISAYSTPVVAFGGDMVSYEYRAASARWYRIQ